MENKIEGTEKKTENEETEPERANVDPVNVENISQSKEEKTACAEDKTENMGEALPCTGEMTAKQKASRDVEKKRNGKNKINKKIAAGLELAAAFVLAVLSGWLFFNTRGTRLLYVSVTAGRVSRYYWIFLAAAVIFLVGGVITLRLCRKESKENKEKLSARENVIEEN